MYELFCQTCTIVLPALGILAIFVVTQFITDHQRKQ